MADLADSDPRAARWEARFRTPIIVAALAVLPLLALSLSSPQGVWHAKAFKTLKLAKAIKLAKLGKSVRVVRKKAAPTDAASIALGVAALALAAGTVVYMITGSAPWKGDMRTIAFVVAGVLATFGVNHLRRERAA